MTKTAEFGVPIPARVVAGVCRVCGCTQTTACNVFEEHSVPGRPGNVGRYERACGWADETRTLCDNPSCTEAARRELNTNPAEAEQLRRPFEGKRYGFAPPRGRR